LTWRAETVRASGAFSLELLREDPFSTAPSAATAPTLSFEPLRTRTCEAPGASLGRSRMPPQWGQTCSPSRPVERRGEAFGPLQPLRAQTTVIGTGATAAAAQPRGVSLKPSKEPLRVRLRTPQALAEPDLERLPALAAEAPLRAVSPALVLGLPTVVLPVLRALTRGVPPKASGLACCSESLERGTFGTRGGVLGSAVAFAAVWFWPIALPATSGGRLHAG